MNYSTVCSHLVNCIQEAAVQAKRNSANFSRNQQIICRQPSRTEWFAYTILQKIIQNPLMLQQKVVTASYNWKSPYLLEYFPYLFLGKIHLKIGVHK